MFQWSLFGNYSSKRLSISVAFILSCLGRPSVHIIDSISDLTSYYSLFKHTYFSNPVESCSMKSSLIHSFSIIPYPPSPCLCVCLVFLCIYVLGAHSVCLLRAIEGFQAALEIKPSRQGLSLNQQRLSEQQYLVHTCSCRQIQWAHASGHSTTHSSTIFFREEQPICGLNRVFVEMCLWYVSSMLTAQPALLSPLLHFL